MTSEVGAGGWQGSHPSPLQAIRLMRADAQDAVVALGSQTASQKAAYVSGRVDDEITALASADRPPHAIFITGSAGGGKSGAAEYQRQRNAHLFSRIVEDATHADDPGKDQADTLAQRLDPLSDGALSRPDRPLLVAANIGMLIQLAPLWASRGHRFGQLVAALFQRLGLPIGPGLELSADPASPAALPLTIEVLNLDHRPTSGEDGLLSDMLKRLDPTAADSLFKSERCEACPAIAHCPAQANAVLLSSVARPQFAALARRAALESGRSDTPRALWDLISRVILPPALYDGFADPCDASIKAHRSSDTGFVLTGLLTATAFAAAGEIGRRVALQDPSNAPTKGAYEAFANAGLVPERDAAPMRDLADAVAEQGMRAPALETAVAALAAPTGVLEPMEERAWRDSVARTEIGARFFLGELNDPSAGPDARFFDALSVYERWQAAVVEGRRTQELEAEVDDKVSRLARELADGFAALFGASAQGETYLPVHNYDVRGQTRTYVQFTLGLGDNPPVLDGPFHNNKEGTRRVGYRPVAITMQLGDSGTRLIVDLPTYRILVAAQRGMASSRDAERTFALRRAAGTLARIAARNPLVPMLVDDAESAARYALTPQVGFGGNTNLSTRMVTE